jgi:hypothetical protein
LSTDENPTGCIDPVPGSVRDRDFGAVLMIKKYFFTPSAKTAE